MQERQIILGLQILLCVKDLDLVGAYSLILNEMASRYAYFC